MPASSTATIYSVSQVAEQVHELLESSFPQIWVEGEVSNCKTYPSGHTYLTLKDEKAQLKAVLFKGAALGLKFKLADGLKILARARVTTYVPRGDLQLILSSVEPREKGALQLAFEQLKARLQAEGLFDEERKRSLPPYPTKIGIVTSLQGAAVRDILHVLERRWPGLEILIRPAQVQGEGAAQDIAQAVRDLNEEDLDILLVGRGGGSIEDLWAFNEEAVARAIAASRIPVISCVGHETDFTIADFVADQRAPTPSAAAQLAVPEKKSVLDELSRAQESLLAAILSTIDNLSQRLSFLSQHPFLKSPHRIYEERMNRVDELALRLFEAIRQILAHTQKDLTLQVEKLDAFSPLKVLARGYSITTKVETGEIIRSSKQLKPNDRLQLRFHDGQSQCEVLS